MSETIEIRITGAEGKTDGYAEIVLSIIASSGVFKNWALTRDLPVSGKESIYINAETEGLPLGHLGASDIPVRKSMSPREQAVHDANAFREMVRDEEYLILDTETTGLAHGEIVQICVLNQAGDTLMYEYVKPVGRIPLEATAIHGISDAMVSEARTWAQVSADLLKLLEGKNVVIYNAVYDRKMMHQSAEAAGLPKVDWKAHCKFWCAMETFAVIYAAWNEYRQSYRWQRLTSAADYFDIEVGGSHDAKADCLTTLAICKHIGVMFDIQ